MPDATPPADPEKTVSRLVAKLEATIEEQKQSYFEKTRKYGHRTFRIKGLTIVFGALITILLGMKLLTPFAESVFSNAALILGAAITALNAWGDYTQDRQLWIRFSIAAYGLDSLQRELQFIKEGGKGGLSADVVDNLFDRLERIIGDVNEEWQELRKPPKQDAA
jgi:hypothetical protein